MKLYEVQSQLELMERLVVTQYDQQTKASAELSRLCTLNAHRTAKTTESKSVVTESERPADVQR